MGFENRVVNEEYQSQSGITDTHKHTTAKEQLENEKKKKRIIKK